MFYTILGALLGGTATFVMCKVCNVSFKSSSNSVVCVPSPGTIFTALGVLAGGSLGFGYGLHALTTGNHPMVNLIKH